MEILDIKVLKGPNYWSIARKNLIVLKLDIDIYEHLPSNQLDEFNQRIKNLLPSLYHHHCSRGVEGGFFARLEEGTWLGHVVEHIALELQNLAGLDCGYGRTFSSRAKGIYHVIFSYQIEEIGVCAAKIAVKIADCLARGEDYLSLAQDLNSLRKVFNEQRNGPSTEALIREAERRGIPFYLFEGSSLITFGQGCHQKRVWASVTSETSAVAVDIVSDKQMTKDILAAHFIPTPEGVTLKDINELDNIIERLQFPIVIKPLKGNHGRAVTTNIRNKEKAIAAFRLAKSVADEILVEQFITGEDYRFLVINYRVVAVAKRTPAMVIGDGIHSIQELVEETNKDPKRGQGHEDFLTAISIDEATLAILEEKKLTLDSILPKDKILYLKHSANLSTGGTATDVSKHVHPANIELAERVAEILHLDVCGIDVISQDIKFPIEERHGAIIEVNAGPGLRMHISPSYGESQNVASPFMDMLYPRGIPHRIPVIAVAGTSGKTTVVRLIAHLASQFGFYVGFSNTEGIYINKKLIKQGDYSDSQKAKAVLRDPLVDFAILECSSEGIFNYGLGFDRCDVSIITNLSETHMHLDGIDSVEELAKLKAVVAESTVSQGYAILNAEDDLVYGIRSSLNCNVALFASRENPRIVEHCENGGLAAYVQNEEIVVRRGQHCQNVAPIKEIPITFNGTATAMIKNILPAVLTAVINNFPLINIEHALYDFYPSVDNLPGRMNIIHFDDFQVMIDYAHNAAVYVELKEFLNEFEPNKKKIGIFAVQADKSEEDITCLCIFAEEMFDEVIIYHSNKNYSSIDRQLNSLRKEAANSATTINIMPDGLTAVRYAMKNAESNSFIYYSADDVFAAITILMDEKKIKSGQFETEGI
nr:cyanophycin synthetase [Legionella jordanis]